MTVVLAAVLFVFIIVLWMAKQTADPYGDFHLSLNKLSDEEIPRTEWLNMGYWKDTDVFPKACEALALKLVQVAGCKPGAKVLDVGHGSGESLIFLLTHPSVPRPSHITGITSLPLHFRRSQARIARLSPAVPVVLHAGDAIYRPGAALDHPFSPSSDRFDMVLALDCAYHFRPRVEFLRQAFSALDRGGSIALADICFTPGALQTRWTQWVTTVLRLMPHENLISTDEYLAQMHDIGYTDLGLENITDEVFPGFIRFLETRGLGWRLFGAVLRMYWRAGAQFVLVRGTRG